MKSKGTLHLYKRPKKHDNTKNYCKLIIVIVMSVVFIGGQILGGVLSHSISVISDATHLITDLVGFVVSFIFLFYSDKAPNKKNSFGFHRMEVVGALANLFIIWCITVFLLFQATNRIINKEFVEDPKVMLIVAGAGLAVNIVMYFVLHTGQGGHSHGLGQKCGHDHPDQEEERICGNCNKPEEQEGHQCSQSQIMLKELNHNRVANSTNDISRNAINIELNEQRELPPVKPPVRQSKSPTKQTHDHNHEHNHEHNGHKCNNNHGSHQHKHHNEPAIREINQQIQLQEHKHGEDCKHDHASHKHEHPQKKGHAKHDEDNHGHGSKHNHDHNHDHDHDHGDQNTQSISMKAAILHALTDIIQSIGLLISALVIYFCGSQNGARVTEFNNWHYLDPISTYLFSILVVISTWPITKQCYYIILEATPEQLDSDALHKEFQELPGVRQMHDFHVWQLRPTKILLTAHVFSQAGREKEVLHKLTTICRKHKIYHTTIQVEQWQHRESDDYIRCEHDIH